MWNEGWKSARKRLHQSKHQITTGKKTGLLCIKNFVCFFATFTLVNINVANSILKTTVTVCNVNMHLSWTVV